MEDGIRGGDMATDYCNSVSLRNTVKGGKIGGK